MYASREKGVPTGAFGTAFNDSANHSIDSRQYLDLKYDRKFGSDRGVMGRVYFDPYPYDDTFIFDLSAFGGPSRAVFKDHGPGQWWGAEGAFSKKLWGNQTLVVGAEFRDNMQQVMVNYLVDPPVPVADVRKSSTVSAVYAQDAIPLRHNLVLDLGLRYDHYSTFGGTVNPRAALIYHPFEKTTLKFLYGQSFRAPNAYELYFQSTNSFSQAFLPNGNPNLKPETARTTEVVVEHDIGHEFLVVLSGCYYPIRGLISAETDLLSGAYVYENGQHVNLRGTEIALKRQSRSGLEAGVSLSLQDAQTGTDGPPLTNSPHTLIQANLSLPLFHRKLYASSNINYVSRRSTLQGNFAEAYAVPNFTLFSNAFKRWEVSVSLYNAFNRRFGDPRAPRILRTSFFRMVEISE